MQAKGVAIPRTARHGQFLLVWRLAGSWFSSLRFLAGSLDQAHEGSHDVGQGQDCEGHSRQLAQKGALRHAHGIRGRGPLFKIETAAEFGLVGDRVHLGYPPFVRALHYSEQL